jgi:hypothetical protein
MRAVLRPGVWLLTWVAALEIVAAVNPLCARRDASEQELTARITQEGNPTRKAKLEIQLGELKLSEAIAAYDGNQFETAPKLLETYRGWMHEAWDLLEKSGRDAGRKPQGFKDLDIALRESARRLDDLKARTPYVDRDSIEKVAAQIDTLHTQVFAVLFPGEQLKDLKDSPPTTPPKPSTPPPAALRPGDPKP